MDDMTAFYLPKNVAKGLFVHSATTAQEVRASFTHLLSKPSS